MEILFSEERIPGEAILRLFYKAADLCVQKEGIDPNKVTVSITFVGSDEIKELNKIYRNNNKVTDVLSFPQYESFDNLPEFGQICIGDVVICTEQALIQADEYGHTPERELVYLFVHSILHLLGYDHMDEVHKREMRQAEEEIMKNIGLERQAFDD